MNIDIEKLKSEEMKNVIACYNRRNGCRYSNIKEVLIESDGINWGYRGTGPHHFALNILMHFTKGDEALSRTLCSDFVLDFIEALPEVGGQISAKEILSWIEIRRKTAAWERSKGCYGNGDSDKLLENLSKRPKPELKDYQATLNTLEDLGSSMKQTVEELRREYDSQMKEESGSATQAGKELLYLCHAIEEIRDLLIEVKCEKPNLDARFQYLCLALKGLRQEKEWAAKKTATTFPIGLTHGDGSNVRNGKTGISVSA